MDNMRKNVRSSQGRLRAAAKALFAEKGYEATAISDITRAARTSHSQFLKYYSGKQELRREIVEEQWSELTKAIILTMSSIPSPAEKLKLAMNMFVSFLENDPEFRAILLLERTVSRKAGRIVADHEFHEFVVIVDEIVNEMASGGELQSNVNKQTLRSALIGSVEGMMRDQLLAGSDFPARYSVEEVRSMVSMIVASACDFQRPRAEAHPNAMLRESSPTAQEDDWIRYYLKLADRALTRSELS
jgi:AcrR family transcriptional regulator